MDFFARQAQSQRRSRWLLAAFVLALLATVAAINLLALLLWQLWQQPATVVGFSRLQLQLWLQQPGSWLIALLSLALIAGTSLIRHSQLRSGGSAVALLLGGREVQRGTSLAHEQQLLNVVDEMAIAARRVPPRVFIIDGEVALNAFVAGSSSHNMALVVTEGLLSSLNRDELQGVIGHEFSHIVHGDVQLNTRLIAYLAGLLMISRLGRLLLRLSYGGSHHGSHRRSGRQGGGIVLLAGIGIALWLIGWIGWMAGRLIQAAVSRQREFLADASAVQFTRHTDGLAGALQKILAHPLGGRMLAANASEISHMCIANSLLSGVSWLATHPPLEARIRALKPWFRMLRQHQDGRRPVANGHRPEQATASFSTATTAAIPLATASSQRQQLESWAGSALHQPAAASHWLLALLVANQRQPQPALVASQLPPEQQLDLDLLVQRLADLPTELRLPLLELLLATARQQPQAERDRLEAQLITIIDSDGDRSLFDLLALALWQQQQPQPAERPLIRSYRHVERELHLLLSALAHAAPSNADKAFVFAASGFGLRHEWPLPPCELHASAISEALQTLATLHPQLKPPLLTACRETALRDQQLSNGEQELLLLLQLVLER